MSYAVAALTKSNGSGTINLYTINTSTAAPSFNLNLGGPALGPVFGGVAFITAATSTAPEPSTVLLAGAGLLTVAFGLKRKVSTR